MKNLFVIFLLGLSTLTFSQSLSDTIDFKFFNPYLVNQEVIQLLNEERYINGLDSFKNDTISMFIAKYHTDYVVKYNDESEIHNKEMLHFLYGNDVEVSSILSTPINRFMTLNFALKRYIDGYDVESRFFICESTNFITISSKNKISYKNLVDLIIFQIKSSPEKNQVFEDDNNPKKRFGISNNFVSTNDNDVRFLYTFVMSEY
jgi:hypothetical protein